MSAPHFFVDLLKYSHLETGDEVELSREDSAHALRSLRMRTGEPISIANDVGAVAEGHLLREQDGLAIVGVDSVIDVPEAKPQVQIAMAPPKGDRLWWAVQKLGELGVDSLCLSQTERTIRLTRDRLVRAERIAREAAMQSRRPTIMTVSDCAFEELVGTGGGLRILLWEQADVLLRHVLSGTPEWVTLFVGPEGSFTDDEAERATQAGFVPASLGPGILRTETAAVVGAALVLHRYGRLG